MNPLPAPATTTSSQQSIIAQLLPPPPSTSSSTMDLCRVCLATVADGGQTATLFSTTYQSLQLCDMLSACTALPIHDDDGMPVLICANCLTNLITAHDFRTLCWTTDARLRDIMQLPALAASKLGGGGGGGRRTAKQSETMHVVEEVVIGGGQQHDDVIVEEAELDGIIDETTESDDGGGPIKHEQHDDGDGQQLFDDMLVEHGEVEEHEVIEYEVENLEFSADATDDHIEYQVEGNDADAASSFGMEMADDGVGGEVVEEVAIYTESVAESNDDQLDGRRWTTPSCRSSVAAGAESLEEKVMRPTVVPAAEYPCTVCPLVFNKQFRLNAHMNSHAVSKKYYECDKCKVRFPNELALSRHRMKHDDKIAEPLLRRDEIYWRRYTCEVCGKKMNTRGGLADHRLDEHALEQPFIGVGGDNEDDDNEEHNQSTEAADGGLNTSARSNESAKTDADKPSNQRYLCEHCPRIFSSKTVLHRHLRSHTGAGEEDGGGGGARGDFVCTLCERSFASEQQYERHAERHKKTKRYACDECDKVFTHVGSLKAHMKTHTVGQAFLCSECGKSFGNAGNLKTHMIRHSGAKPFECKQCYAKFPIKGDLYNHMKTHTGARPATCDICGSSFTRQSTLNKHKLIHVGIRPYPCEMCEMRFSSSDHVKRHMRIHTGEKPFKCEYCPRAFTQKNDLVKHTRSHIGDNTYQCKQCPAAYRLFNDLKVHARTHQLTLGDLMGGEYAKRNKMLINAGNQSSNKKEADEEAEREQQLVDEEGIELEEMHGEDDDGVLDEEHGVVEMLEGEEDMALDELRVEIVTGL